MAAWSASDRAKILADQILQGLRLAVARPGDDVVMLEAGLGGYCEIELTAEEWQ